MNRSTLFIFHFIALNQRVVVFLSKTHFLGSIRPTVHTLKLNIHSPVSSGRSHRPKA